MSRRFGLGLVGAAALAVLQACSSEASLGAPEAFSLNTVGPQGGTLQGGKIILQFPVGALNETIDITAIETFDVPVPEAVILVGPAFDLEPDGTEFAQPVGVTIDLSAASVGVSTPVLYHSSDDEIFDPVADSQFDAGNKSLRGSITHFSFVAAFIPIVD